MPRTQFASEKCTICKSTLQITHTPPQIHCATCQYTISSTKWLKIATKYLIMQKTKPPLTPIEDQVT